MYLSTFTRATGLLLGAAAAFVWRPWRGQPGGAVATRAGRSTLAVGGAALGGARRASPRGHADGGLRVPVAAAAGVGAALVAVLVAVHPAARGIRPCSSWRPLVAVGKRSYGLYLWHWPIFVLAGATHGSVGRFVVALAVTVVVTELSYRFVETPVRRGALGAGGASAGPSPRPRRC